MKKRDLLLAIDLEDVRDQIPDGQHYQDRVEVNVEQILDLLKSRNARATFFTVGTLARRLPGLLQKILDQGHEIAAHGNNHTQLTKLDPLTFEADLIQNVDSLLAAGVPAVSGFRAPTFSLTERTGWAHDVLASRGFKYSSSVLPAKNPLFGWPEFGEESRRLPNGLVEIPITLHPRPLPRVPLAGGVYLRVLPFSLTRFSFGRLKPLRPVTTYIHPYDVDIAQEHFMHPDLNGSRWMNGLMYIGRQKALARLGRLIDQSKVWRYVDWVEQHYTA